MYYRIRWVLENKDQEIEVLYEDLHEDCLENNNIMQYVNDNILEYNNKDIKVLDKSWAKIYRYDEGV